MLHAMICACSEIDNQRQVCCMEEYVCVCVSVLLPWDYLLSVRWEGAEESEQGHTACE